MKVRFLPEAQDTTINYKLYTINCMIYESKERNLRPEVFPPETEPEKPKIEELEEKIRLLEKEVREGTGSLREREREIKEEIKKYLEELREIPETATPITERDEVKEIAPLSASEQVGALVSLVFQERNGLEKAIKIADALGPAILDEFHDTLIDHYYQKLLEEQILKEKAVEGLDFSLLLVTVPQAVPKEKEKPLQEFFKTVEQFFSSLASVKPKKKVFLFFQTPLWLVFEMAVPRIGEETHFYVACPRNWAETVEKQILGFWPDAQVQPSFDYNIFNPQGHSVGSYATLKKNPVLPLKSFEEFSTDPLSVITSVFSKLAKIGEGATVQFLIRPDGGWLKKTGERIVESLKEGKKPDDILKKISAKEILKDTAKALFSLAEGRKPVGKYPQSGEKTPPIPTPPPSLSPTGQKIMEAVLEKTSQPMFETNIRLVASANNRQRAEEILNQLQGSFEQFSTPVLNQLIFQKPKSGKLKKFFYDFSFRLFDNSQRLIFSSSELASLFHFPSPGLVAPRIKWLRAKQAPPPANLPEDGLAIGKSLYRGESRGIRVLEEDRRRHFYIIGQTGTGKSTLLREMIRQDMENGKGVALIDPHGELAEDVLETVPRSRVKDVIYFNPSDFERPIGLNMLEYDPMYPEAKTFVVNELLEIFDKLYNLTTHGFGGPVYEQYMRNALLLVMEDPESGNTLIEVPRVLSDSSFRRQKLAKCQNIIVKNFWELEAEKAGGEMALANLVPYITSKMNIFIANDLVRPIIAQEHSSFNFREIMDNQKILLVNLSKGKLGDINSYLLGMIISGRLLLAAFSRADVPLEERKDFYLYIDEFHSVTTKTIASALAEARKYRLSLALAHQYIGQLDEETKKAIFGNIGSMLTFRVGPEDAKYLLTQYEPAFNETDLINLDNFNGALRLLIRGETSAPFNIVTIPPAKGNPGIAALIKDNSRLIYGRDRKVIEADLYKRLQKTTLPSRPTTSF